MTPQHFGLYDSGIGGLTVLKSLQRVFPRSEFSLFSDQKFFPFGTQTSKTIYESTKKGIAWLQNIGCDTIVLACHTASHIFEQKTSATSLPPIVPMTQGVIEGLKNIKIQAPLDKIPAIFMLATQRTTQNNPYEKKARPILPQNFIWKNIACPEFAQNIEKIYFSNLKPFESAENICFSNVFKSLDSVDTKKAHLFIVHGCTHYPLGELLIAQALEKYAPNLSKTFIDPGHNLAIWLKKIHAFEKKNAELSKESNTNSMSPHIYVNKKNFSSTEISKWQITSSKILNHSTNVFHISV